MTDKSEIRVIWKEVGLTMGQLVDDFKRRVNYSGPVTFAGRLDPMAEGLVILLLGEKVKEKEKYLNLRKEYEFECLWAVVTDSLDILGKVTGGTGQVPKQENIESEVLMSLGKFVEEYPLFSSKTVAGKPLFWWAKEGKLNDIEIPEREMEVFSLSYISSREVGANDIQSEILEKISKVEGDFRQVEIKALWSDYFEKNKNSTFLISKMIAKVSSGTYVRSIVSKMGRGLGCGATTFSIKRKRVGEYTEEDLDN